MLRCCEDVNRTGATAAAALLVFAATPRRSSPRRRFLPQCPRATFSCRTRCSRCQTAVPQCQLTLAAVPGARARLTARVRPLTVRALDDRAVAFAEARDALVRVAEPSAIAAACAAGRCEHANQHSEDRPPLPNAPHIVRIGSGGAALETERSASVDSPCRQRRTGSQKTRWRWRERKKPCCERLRQVRPTLRDVQWIP
jgi:hypothetical protein